MRIGIIEAFWGHHLDELAGPARALTPPHGPERRKVMQAVALALGTTEKCVALFLERLFHTNQQMIASDFFEARAATVGALVTMTYYGADKVVENYNVMGPVKAALESTVRYLAAELGSKKIRVHAVSPGPLKTRAASGIAHFDKLIEEAIARTPEHRLVDIEDVGMTTAFLVSGGARALTGDTIYVDGGFHNMA